MHTARHLFLTLTALLAFAASADAGGETARQILDRRKSLDDSARRWNDAQHRMRLTIVDRGGRDRVRELVLYQRRYGDEQRTIMFLVEPAELRGTGLLIFTRAGEGGQQWLFTPALQRVRQITSKARTESFIGSDFTYHDLDLLAEIPSWSEADAASRLRGEERIEGTDCYVIELTPRRDSIAYKYVVLWLGRDDLILRQVELYDRNPVAADEPATPTKRLRQGEVRAVEVMDRSIPVAHRAVVENPTAGTQTIVEFTDVQFDQGLDGALFTQIQLERGNIPRH
jgi:outer membrane lipoprotein-sorting protein